MMLIGLMEEREGFCSYNGLTLKI